MLYAMVFPFVLAGVIFGLIWAVLNHFGNQYNPRKAIVHVQEEFEDVGERAIEAEETVLQIQVPEYQDVTEDIPEEEPEAIVAQEDVKSPFFKEIDEPAAVLQTKHEDFFPLEIDKNDEFGLPAEEPDFRSELTQDEAELDQLFALPSIDSGLYESQKLDSLDAGVMIEDSLSMVSMDIDEDDVLSEDAATAFLEREVKEPEPPVADHVAKPADQKHASDWLSSHMELLNRLK